MTTRRTILKGAGGLLAWGLTDAARAASAAPDRKLLFVFAPGGWDPTRVFADGFDTDGVDMEAGSERATAGRLPYIDHGSRPSVRAFFEAEHHRALVVNGVMVRSIAHEICTMIAMTGTSSGLAPDWPAIVANSDTDGFTLPHLVLDGPSFPGDLGVAVARSGVNGQLEALVSGAAHDWSADPPVSGPDRVSESLVDRYMLRRAQAREQASVSAIEQRLTGDFRKSMDKLAALKDLRHTTDFTAGADLVDQASVAADLFAQGVTRCATLSYTGADRAGWDTHADNDNQQALLWEGLFQGLTQLMAELDMRTAPSGARLSEETLVVVLSEMGRTPAKNLLDGKDHWPYTSAMLLGAGITGDRAIGGFGPGFTGMPLDPATADVVEDGPLLSAEALGATILAAAGVDPEPYVSGVAPISGVLL
jgi:uncharacterized protein (DUF1501 family)